MCNTKKKSPRHSTVRATRRRWTKALKNTKFNELVQVRRFSFGGFSKVSLVQLKNHPTSAFALKSIRKDSLVDKDDREGVMSEKSIMNEVDSPFIVKLYKTYKDTRRLYFLTEFCPGGDLFNQRCIPESSAKFYVACVVEALACLHANNIAFNDLKAENLVLDREGYARLIDFGFARKHLEGQLAFDFCGTDEYLPPEVVLPAVDEAHKHEGRDRAVDLWALGCLLSFLIKGRTPFETTVGASKAQIFANVLKGIDEVYFPEALFSTSAVDLMRKLCVKVPNQRLGYKDIGDIRKHEWFEGFDWKKLRARRLEAPKKPKVDSVLDTHNFDVGETISESEAEEVDSDWDKEF